MSDRSYWLAMPLTVTHLIDSRTSEDAARLTSLLLRLAPAQRLQHRVVLLGPAPRGLTIPDEVAVDRVPLRFDLALLSLPGLRRVLQRHRPDVLHTPGAQSVAAAGMLRRVGVSVPVIATIADPGEVQSAGRWWRTLHDDGGGVELACTSSMVQRRLIEAGIPPAATAVIRPGVDFGELRHAKERLTREELGLPADGPVLVMPSPPSRGGGQFLGVWAVGILYQIWPGVRLLIPGCSREAIRIGRLRRQIYCPEAFVLTGDRYTPAQLLSVSDAMLVPAVEDIPTGWLAWAMAAGVPIIGSAILSVTEYIADRQNGFLFKPGVPHTLAIRIRTVIESPHLMRRCAEMARGQAYDVFRAQQCVEHYATAFSMRAVGRSAVTAVHDAAFAT